MIQIKRGTTKKLRQVNPVLASGQPGYDKNKHKIKIGDGKTSWKNLHYASGLFSEEILNSESKAKARYKADKEDKTIITHGKNSPDKDTVGQVYLQYHEANPETDYIVSHGTNRGWHYQKWNSGFARCSGTFEFRTTVRSAIGANLLYKSGNNMKQISYPFTFKKVPNELASVKSPSGLVWLSASKKVNTTSKSAAYGLISPNKLTNSTTYKITLIVEGLWK